MPIAHKSFAVALIGILGIAGCGNAASHPASSGSSPSTTSPSSTSTASPQASSPSTAAKTAQSVDVAYAGSMQLANNTVIGPAFEKATGIHFSGRGGGAFGVAHLISGKEITPNVFESIGTGPVAVIAPQFTNWAVGYASSPLVLAYSDKSPYAAQLNAIAKGQKPLSSLFSIMERSGFHLGRTNPETDPQGSLFILMLQLAQKQLHLPQTTVSNILGSNDNPQQIFSETGILSRLQAGQLDAASAYLPEAIQRHLPYIAFPKTMNLGDPSMAKTYASVKITLKNGKTMQGSPIEVYITTVGKPTPAGVAFVRFALSAQGKKLMQQEGYNLTAPVVWGKRSDIPASILAELK